MVALADNPAERPGNNTRRRKFAESVQSRPVAPCPIGIAASLPQSVDGWVPLPAAASVDESFDCNPYGNTLIFAAPGAELRQEPKSRHTAGAAPRVISQDPAGYINGANIYQYVMSNPVGSIDMAGRAVIPTTVAEMAKAYITGRGNWSGTQLSTPGKTNYPDTAHLSAQFNIDKKSFSDPKCIPCTEIKFVQFYIESYIFLLWSRRGGNWSLDLNHAKSPPFYAFQNPWEAGGRPTEARMHDYPGLWLGNESYFFEEDFMTWAVCTKEKESGHSYGSLHWGILVHPCRDTTTIWLAGASPPRTIVNLGTYALLRIS